MGWRTTAGVAFVADGGERVFDGGADPGAAGDALALEGEEPGFEVGELTARRIRRRGRRCAWLRPGRDRAWPAWGFRDARRRCWLRRS